MINFVNFDKEKLAQVATRNLSKGDGTDKTNFIIMEIDGVQKRVEGYYYESGHLVLTDKPVKPRNE